MNIRKRSVKAVTALVTMLIGMGLIMTGMAQPSARPQAAQSQPGSNATPASRLKESASTGMVRKTVRSKDGTSIAHDQAGDGPVLILVASALSDRNGAARLAGLLARNFTVINYDRRGRGASGDNSPYAVEREIEDLEALIDAAGGSAFVFGSSAGAVLALEAAAKLPAKVRKLAVYEPPFIVDNTRPPVPADFVPRVRALVAAGRRSDAVECFLIEGAGMPSDAVSQLRKAPMWPAMEKLAHTLAYDGTIMADTQAGRPLPANRWSSITAPTLVIDGAKSDPFLQNAAKALGDVLPNARRHTIAGQDHSAVVRAPQAVAPVLVEFFSGPGAPR